MKKAESGLGHDWHTVSREALWLGAPWLAEHKEEEEALESLCACGRAPSSIHTYVRPSVREKRRCTEQEEEEEALEPLWCARRRRRARARPDCLADWLVGLLWSAFVYVL